MTEEVDMLNPLLLSVQLEATDCYNCGVTFAMPDNLMRRFRDSGNTFYCPNGHGQKFTETTEDQLRRTERALERAQASRRAAWDQADAAERSKRALRGANTKLRNKLAAGTCPCCETTFPDLAEHMAAEHPDFADAET
jgi:hypothetical protein